MGLPKKSEIEQISPLKISQTSIVGLPKNKYSGFHRASTNKKLKGQNQIVALIFPWHDQHKLNPIETWVETKIQQCS